MVKQKAYVLVKSRAEVDHVLDMICGARGGAQIWLYWEALRVTGCLPSSQKVP